MLERRLVPTISTASALRLAGGRPIERLKIDAQVGPCTLHAHALTAHTKHTVPLGTGTLCETVCIVARSLPQAPPPC
jgi:hypothetical protein